MCVHSAAGVNDCVAMTGGFLLGGGGGHAAPFYNENVGMWQELGIAIAVQVLGEEVEHFGYVWGRGRS